VSTGYDVSVRVNSWKAGGLIGYAADSVNLFRRAATFVEKRPEGATPGDLPSSRHHEVRAGAQTEVREEPCLTIPKVTVSSGPMKVSP